MSKNKATESELERERLTQPDYADVTHISTGGTLETLLEEVYKSPPSFVCLIAPPSYQGKRWEISKPEFIIGRSFEHDISIYDPSLSKSHAKVTYDGTKVTLTDLESTNKTELNERELPSKVEIMLNNNDQIKLGNVILKFLESGNLESISHKKSFDLRLRDPLTEIFNRSALVDKGNDEFQMSSILDYSLSIIIFDIDDFKEVNDNHGHLAGDYVLKEMAHLVKHQAIRSNDYFARYGGEEFVLILPNSPIHEAMTVAERIRAIIERHDFFFEGKKLPITISAGVACRCSETRVWEELFKKADQACYESKRDGRNRVTTL